MKVLRTGLLLVCISSFSFAQAFKYKGTIDSSNSISISFIATPENTNIRNRLTVRGYVVFDTSDTYLITGVSASPSGDVETLYPRIVLYQYLHEKQVGIFHLTFNKDFTELSGFWTSSDKSENKPVFVKLVSKGKNLEL